MADEKVAGATPAEKAAPKKVWVVLEEFNIVNMSGETVTVKKGDNLTEGGYRPESIESAVGMEWIKEK